MTRPDLAPILQNVLDAVIVMGRDGTVQDWNAGAHRIFGWRREEAINGRMSSLIIPFQHRAAHERGLQHYLATGEGPVLGRRIEITAVTRDGREIPVELSIIAVGEGDEEVFLGFIRDISERKAAEAALAAEKAALEVEVVRREAVERHQALLLAEMNHRVKNMLAVVTGLAMQTGLNSPSVEAFMHSFSGRLASMSRSYGLVTEANWSRTELRRLVEDQLAAHLDPAEGRIDISGDPIALSPRQALSISMVLHELATNAVKHGALAEPAGRIEVAWRRLPGEPAQLELEWRETGAASPAEAVSSKPGFGSKMIGAVVRHDLKGELTREWNPSGLSCRIVAPLPEDTS